LEQVKNLKVLTGDCTQMKTQKTQLVLSLRQILTVGEQRAKVMGKTGIANVFRKGKDAIRKQHGKA